MENTTDTQLTPFEQTKQEAREKIASMTLEDIAGYIALTKTRVSELETSNRETRNRLQQLVDTVTEFIKDNYESGASSGDLKDLAEELDIELTKTIKVEMKISYYADLIVPIDFDVESIDESDFEVEVTFNNTRDTEIDNDSTEVDSFDTREE